MKSKYIVFPDKQQVEVREEEITEPEAGQILCRAEKSLISTGTELNCLRGESDPGTNWSEWVKYPFRPGYSMVGQVIAVGSGVTGIKEGDRIASYGVHQQYYKISLDDPSDRMGISVLPGAISSEEGTWRSLAVTTQGGVRRATFQFGETVGVVGLGILGQLVTQYLAAAGARNIVVIDPLESRLTLAMQYGATHALQMSANDAAAAIREITKGWMLDVVFDVTGHPAVLAPCVRLVRKFGRVVLLGDTPTPTQQYLGPGVVSNSVAILGIHGYAVPEKTTEFTPWTIDTMGSLFFDYLIRGKMKVADLVTHRYSPQEAPQVYQDLFKDRTPALGVIFDWTLLN